MSEKIATEVLVDVNLEKHLRIKEKSILYVGIRYDYGHPDWGLSFEHYNFYHTFLNMGYSLIYFDYDRLHYKYGDKRISEMLLEAVYYYNPDILFYFHFHDWIDYDAWHRISNEFPTKTIIWLSDDRWRYEESRPIWELFNLVITTDKKGIERRKEEGFNNILLGQWGCNNYLCNKLNITKIYDVVFIGGCHGNRKELVEQLIKEGIKIKTFGRGWGNGNEGRISQLDLIRIYNQSKIVFNMSFTSKMDRIQVNSRDFEAPGCGSLLLTRDTDEIRECFMPDKEIITYKDVDDAVDKIKFYLMNDAEREKIAKNGYKRVMKDHTYENRFLNIKELI